MGGTSGTYKGPPHTAADWRKAMEGGLIPSWMKPKAGDILPDAPPPPPDLSDEVAQRARLAAIRRAQMGGGLSGSFLTGPLGDTSPTPTSTPSLGGS